MKRTHSKITPASPRATKLASSLIEAMLREMQLGLNDPKRLETEAWARIFGDKQNMVINLQKLVQSLATLTESRARKANAGLNYQEAEMSLQDTQILSSWLSEERMARDAQ